jgi:hypothetical protein
LLFHYFFNELHAFLKSVQSAHQEKIPAKNAMYAHAQDFAASDELLLAILKAFIPQPLSRQQAFMCSDDFNVEHYHNTHSTQ